MAEIVIGSRAGWNYWGFDWCNCSFLSWMDSSFGSHKGRAWVWCLTIFCMIVSSNVESPDELQKKDMRLETSSPTQWALPQSNLPPLLSYRPPMGIRIPERVASGLNPPVIKVTASLACIPKNASTKKPPITFKIIGGTLYRG